MSFMCCLDDFHIFISWIYISVHIDFDYYCLFSWLWTLMYCDLLNLLNFVFSAARNYCLRRIHYSVFSSHFAITPVLLHVPVSTVLSSYYILVVKVVTFRFSTYFDTSCHVISSCMRHVQDSASASFRTVSGTSLIKLHIIWQRG